MSDNDIIDIIADAVGEAGLDGPTLPSVLRVELAAWRTNAAREVLDAIRERYAIVEDSWDGLMDLLDAHWPEKVFPTMDDCVDRDPGPRIVSLLRRVQQQQKEP